MSSADRSKQNRKADDEKKSYQAPKVDMMGFFRG